MLREHACALAARQRGQRTSGRPSMRCATSAFTWSAVCSFQASIFMPSCCATSASFQRRWGSDAGRALRVVVPREAHTGHCTDPNARDVCYWDRATILAR